MTPTVDTVDCYVQFTNGYEASLSTYPLSRLEDIARVWPNASTTDQLGQRMRMLLLAPASSSESVYVHLKDLERAFLFDDVATGEGAGKKNAAGAMADFLGHNRLIPLSSPNWIEGIAIGRALALSGRYPILAESDAAVDAFINLRAKGYGISAKFGRFVFEDGELERATEDARALLDLCGLLSSLYSWISLLNKKETYAVEMFLPSRKTSMLNTLKRSPPYAFIYNQILRGAPDLQAGCTAESFEDAVDLCTDITSCLDLEQTHVFQTAMVPPNRIDAELQKTGHFEHLLNVRQWPPSTVEFFIRGFFAFLRSNPNENIVRFLTLKENALKIWRHLSAGLREPVPRVLKRLDLIRAGVSEGELDTLLAVICHRKGIVNEKYISPDSASRQPFTSMASAKPLVELGQDRCLMPLPSAFGPALLESLLGYCFDKNFVPSNELLGKGTESLVSDILALRKDVTVYEGKKYGSRDNGEDGECDFIVETRKHILFIECKSKATTRGTMAGIVHEAMLDYAKAVLAPQAQLLQHERILRSKGELIFADRFVLRRNERQIWRLSITLHEHGGLQDPSFIAALTSAFAQSHFSAKSAQANRKNIEELNRLANDIREEINKLSALGLDPRQIQLSSRSLCVSHFHAILNDHPDSDQFIAWLRVIVSNGTQNPLLEYLYGRPGEAFANLPQGARGGAVFFAAPWTR